MVKLIMGVKGTGKTKTLVDLVRKAVEEENGDVVCIERDKELTYDIPYQARLIHAVEYGIRKPELLRGFICGLAAGNYDISHVFIDNLLKITGDVSEAELVEFVDWLAAFSEKESITFTVSVSADPDKYGDDIKKYL